MTNHFKSKNAFEIKNHLKIKESLKTKKTFENKESFHKKEKSFDLDTLIKNDSVGIGLSFRPQIPFHL